MSKPPKSINVDNARTVGMANSARVRTPLSASRVARAIEQAKKRGAYRPIEDKS